MAYLDFKSEYERFPKKKITGYDNHAFDTHDDIIRQIDTLKGVIAVETYPGVDLKHLHDAVLSKTKAKQVHNIESAKKPQKELDDMLQLFVTDDRVFGRRCYYEIDDLYDRGRLNDKTTEISTGEGMRIVYGFGASLIPHDHLIYIDMTRWEIETRYRAGMPNWTAENHDEDKLRKFKRGYFVEWFIADKLKQRVFETADYIMDGNDPDIFTMITMEAMQATLDKLVSEPFRLQPYHDPGVWGGQWMKEVCNLPENDSNYAWSIDGVPEANAIRVEFGGKDFVFPGTDLVRFRPVKLLGDRVHGRFGKEFPIRFDFLDTMEGQNLSLQVHPLTEYIQDNFGMHYTQDESYYIMDAADDSSVYIGVKEDIDPEAMIADLEAAERGEKPFPDEKYVNRFPAKKHDHFSLPGGTVHCSGKNTMVLEISTTPYIFTFKLWDWGRLGLDGKPRPVHVNHGKHVIQFQRDTSWVKENLINPVSRLSDVEERTGLHEREFLETRRYTFDRPVESETHGSVNVCNLVEGKAAIIFSPEEAFEPFEVHYAETFVLPENIKRYGMKPREEGETCKIIKAFVR